MPESVLPLCSVCRERKVSSRRARTCAVCCPPLSVAPLRNTLSNIYKSQQWRVLRHTKLRANPVCESCNSAPSTDVDHIVGMRKGGDPWAWKNLQALCHACHSRKTAVEVKWAGNNRGQGASVLISHTVKVVSA
jgi:5-methylcytosine-specific restriction endonuclease McrA